MYIRTYIHTYECYTFSYTVHASQSRFQPQMFEQLSATYIRTCLEHRTQNCTWGSNPLVHPPLPISWPVRPFPGHFPLRSPSFQLLPGSPHKPLRTHCYLESSTLHESAESRSAGLVSRLLLLLPVHGEHRHHHKLPTRTEQEGERQQVIMKRRGQWCVATGLPTHTQTTTLHVHSQVYRDTRRTRIE